eukprot:10650574-Alexandrium_andersonii.AAC.1
MAAAPTSMLPGMQSQRRHWQRQVVSRCVLACEFGRSLPYAAGRVQEVVFLLNGALRQRFAHPTWMLHVHRLQPVRIGQLARGACEEGASCHDSMWAWGSG